MDNNEQGFEINIIDLLFYLKKKIIWILLIAIVFAGATFGICKYVVTPEYTASTRVYILNKSASSANSLSYSDLQSSSQLANDYEVLITGTNVTSVVIKNLKLNMSNADLKNKISVSNISDSRILQISVVDENPELAAKLANEVRRVAQEQIVKIMEIDAVNLVYEATVPVSPSSPATSKNSAIAGAAGFMLAIVIFFITFISDDSIKSEEDVEKYLKLSTLALVPVNGGNDGSKKGKKSK